MRLKFTISGHLFPTDVRLCLDRLWFSISGFPRLLQMEDSPGGAIHLFPCSTQCQAANSRLVMRKLRGKSRSRPASLIRRRGNWPGPQAPELRDRDDDTISNYSNPNYTIGNSAPAALELPASCETERYELADTSRIAELPARTWPDHLTQHAESDKSTHDDDEVPGDSWI